MIQLLLDADPAGGRLLAGWAAAWVACAALYASQHRRWLLPRNRLVAALACSGLFGLAATSLSLAFLPLTAFPPYAFRFVCLPFWFALICCLMAALPARWKLSLSTLVACVLALSILGFLLRLARRPVFEGGGFTRRHFIYNPESGYQGRPDARVRSRKLLAGRLLYNVEYTHDTFGRRALAVPEHPDSSLLCFGCSFTYGEGVGDSENWPARIAAARPQLAVYNYAFPGWGPAQMLDVLRLRDLSAETASGVPRQAVYYFLDSHVTRVAGSWQFISAWGGSLSRYHLQDGRLLRRGAFSLTQSRPEFLACHTLGGLGLLSGLGLDVAGATSEESLPLVAAVFGAAQERLSGCPLTVVFEPGSRYAAQLVPRLEELGLHCVRLPAGLVVEKIRDDGHPSVAGHQTLADRILVELPANLSGNATYPRGSLPGP